MTCNYYEYGREILVRVANATSDDDRWNEIRYVKREIQELSKLANAVHVIESFGGRIRVP